MKSKQSTATQAKSDSATTTVANNEPLLESVRELLAIHDEWCASDETLLTSDYETAVLSMVRTWAIGDLPASLRVIASAVADVAEEWDEFENYVTLLKPEPRDSFWGAINRLRDSLDKLGTVRQVTIESVSLLIEQRVPLSQIANHIYGYRGEGPFLKGGVVQEELILKEAKSPGSVIPKGWVHPEHVASAQEELESVSGSLRRLSSRFAKPAVAPESIEELLRQKVPAEQIADMKQLALEDVLTEAKRLGLEARHRENLAAMRAPSEPAITAEQESAMDAYVSSGRDAEAAANQPASPATATTPGNETEPVSEADQQIFDLSDSGESLKSIADQLEMKIADVARTLKRRTKPAGE